MFSRKLLILWCLYFITGYLFSQNHENIKDQKPINLYGNIGLNLMAYSVSGIPARQLPFSYVFSANATANIYSIEVPFSFTFSDRQRSYAQSFNQLGLSPRWKWITLHGGYRNVSFSNFTLAGHTFLGGGVELTPGKFRFGAVYGRFDRKTTTSPIFETDSLPHFTRKGFAIKVGVGTENNFFDLIFMRIRDDSTSIQQEDSTNVRLPEQNVIAGFNSRFTFAKKLTWETEVALSLYTCDISANPSIDSNSISPVLLNLNNFLVINQSSEYYSAIRSFLQYKERLWSLKLEYRRIDPAYRSMGAYFFNNDVENITLSPSFSLFKRKLALSGSIGLQRDNLRQSKQVTSTRTIGNVNVSFNPSFKFGIDANYSNYSIDQREGRAQVIDSMKVQQANHNLSLMPRLMFFSSKKSHVITLVYNLADLIDNNEFTSSLNHFISHIGQLNYIIGLTESGWSFNIGLTYSSFSLSASNYTTKGGNIGISKSLSDQKINLSWNNSLVRSIGSDKAWVFNSNLAGNYYINKHHIIRLNIYNTANYQDPGSISKSFNELKGDLGYVYKF